MKSLRILAVVIGFSTLISACIAPAAEDATKSPIAEVNRACAGVPDELRESGPFSMQEMVERVEPLYVSSLSAKIPGTSLVGAKIYVRSTPGLTGPWLHRVTECHIAQHSLTMPDDERSDCPFSLPITEINVDTSGAFFIISLRTENVNDAETLLARANMLVARLPVDSTAKMAAR